MRAQAHEQQSPVPAPVPVPVQAPVPVLLLVVVVAAAPPPPEVAPVAVVALALALVQVEMLAEEQRQPVFQSLPALPAAVSQQRSPFAPASQICARPQHLRHREPASHPAVHP